MANCSRGRPRSTPSAPAATEPEVRRWPHPVVGAEIAPSTADLHYIHCALSYQNQLLSEIKTLLQQLSAVTADPQTQPQITLHAP